MDGPNTFSLKNWADVQFVPVECDGAASRAILLKQLASIGAPNWCPDDRSVLLDDLIASKGQSGLSSDDIVTRLRANGLHIRTSLNLPPQA